MDHFIFKITIGVAIYQQVHLVSNIIRNISITFKIYLVRTTKNIKTCIILICPIFMNYTYFIEKFAKNRRICKYLK